MTGAPPSFALLSEGAEVTHNARGKGVIRGRLEDGARDIEFESGETFRYGPEEFDQFQFEFESIKATGSSVADASDTRLLEKALNLCVVWDVRNLQGGGSQGSIEENMKQDTKDGKMVSRVLASSAKARAVSPIEGVGSLPEVGRALQRALELQCMNVARVIWELPGVSFSTVNMCRLYLQPDTYNVLSSSKQLQMGLRLASNLELASGFTLSDGQRFILYRRALDQTFKGVIPILATFLRRSTQTRAHDVFFWLAFQGNGRIAKQLLPLCDLPVHIALLGSAICRKVAPSDESCSLAETMESWAYGAMEVSASEDRARAVLELPLCSGKHSNALELGYLVSAKRFLTQRAVASYIDLGWRGGFEGAVGLAYGTGEVRAAPCGPRDPRITYTAHTLEQSASSPHYLS